MATTKAARAAQAAAAEAEAAPPPLPFRVPFWVAVVPLPVGTEMGPDSTGSVKAFMPGDYVPDEHVQRYGWQAMVELPPGVAPPPAAAEPPADAAPPADDTSDQAGEAGTDKE